MQPYGINVARDLLGALIAIGVFAVLGGKRSRSAAVGLAVMSALSAAGSGWSSPRR